MGLGSHPRAQRWGSKAADRGEDDAHHRTGDGRFAQQEGDGVGVRNEEQPDTIERLQQADERRVAEAVAYLDAANVVARAKIESAPASR